MRIRHKLTYQDFVALPDDGKVYEVLAGTVCGSSAHHQPSASRETAAATIGGVFEGNGMGEVFIAPVGVVLGTHDIVDPDIVVVTSGLQISRRAIEGALAVEKLSPSNRTYDTVKKAWRYIERGGKPTGSSIPMRTA
jgi:hypothetical protein